MRQSRRPLFILLAAVAIIAAIWSIVFLTNPPLQTLEQRAEDVGSQLKCPICQGESVQNSPSDLARQMRAVIRQQLQSGKSEQEVIQYFADRYGEQIVWEPPWQGFTLLAWLVPIALLPGGIILLFFVLRDWRATAPGFEASANEQSPERVQSNESDLASYRAQLEEELAADDPLFERYGTEAH